MVASSLRNCPFFTIYLTLFICHFGAALAFCQVKLPARPTPPKVSIQRSSLDSWVDGSIASAKQQREANAALKLIDEVLQSPELNDTQKKKLSSERLKLKEYADKGLVRNGQSWITVEEEAKRITQADQLIERGVTYIRVEDDKNAKEVFEDASKTDLNGIRADFILGMMNSPLVAFSPKTAEEHFKEMLRRSPQLPCAMNNLALTLVRQGEFTEALNLLKEMDRQEPGSDLVLYNMTKLVQDIRDRRLQPTKAVSKRIETFYLDLVSGSPADSKLQPTGWRYSNLTLPASEEDRTRFDESSVPVNASVGSGFVIQPGYVITALHPVRECNAISVVFPGGRTFDASLDASVEMKNIAFLKVDDHETPTVPVRVKVPDKTTKMYQLAFSAIVSGTPVVEIRDLKMSAVACPPGSDCFILDGRRKRGYVGGPICDESGNVVGMASSISALDSGLTPVMPISHVLSHLKGHIGKFEEPQQSKIVFDDPAKIIERTGKSVCQVIVSRKYHTFGMGKSDDPRYVLDTKSSCCGGTGKVNCPKKGCNNGQISVKRKVVVAQDPIAGKVYATKVFIEACPRCNGNGTVPCPFGN